MTCDRHKNLVVQGDATKQLKRLNFSVRLLATIILLDSLGVWKVLKYKLFY